VLSSYRIVFFGFSGLCLIVAALYSLLSPAVEIADSLSSARMSPRISSDSKRIIAKITALFSLDAFENLVHAIIGGKDLDRGSTELSVNLGLTRGHGSLLLDL